jgi:hypothetical protein
LDAAGRNKSHHASRRSYGKDSGEAVEGKQPGGSVKDRIALKYENHHDPWLIDPHNNLQFPKHVTYA